MIILGIDPGFGITGYGLIEIRGNKFVTLGYGSVITSPKNSFYDRLYTLCNSLREIITKYKPAVMSIEKLFFSKNTKTAMLVAHARGAIMLEALNHGLEIYEYAPNEVKLALTGYGGADKSQMKKMVKTLLSLDEIPRHDDTADALAIALCHHHSSRFSSLAKKLNHV